MEGSPQASATRSPFCDCMSVTSLSVLRPLRSLWAKYQPICWSSSEDLIPALWKGCSSRPRPVDQFVRNTMRCLWAKPRPKCWPSTVDHIPAICDALVISSQDARGDQCDSCGKLINAIELKVLGACFGHFTVKYIENLGTCTHSFVMGAEASRSVFTWYFEGRFQTQEARNEALGLVRPWKKEPKAFRPESKPLIEACINTLGRVQCSYPWVMYQNVSLHGHGDERQLINWNEGRDVFRAL